MEHLVTEEYDHQAILVRALETAPREKERGPRPFQFEEAWTRHAQYDEMIAQAWFDVATVEKSVVVVGNRLSKMAGIIQWWARQVFGLSGDRFSR